MLISCKVTSAIIRHLEKEGRDIAFLYEESGWPIELLEDSSHWIPAPDMESLITKISAQIERDPAEFVKEVGVATPHLYAWGVLDSVIRMLPSPRSIFKNPGRFLSYFISPEPPVENIFYSDQEVRFDIPFLAEQYPMLTAYFKSAFSALPQYSGEQAGIADWSGIHFSIRFQKSAQLPMDTFATQKQLSPELLADLVEKLQNQQLDLEEKNRELQNQNQKLEQLYAELRESSNSSSSVAEPIATGAGITPMPQGHIYSMQGEFGKESASWYLTQNLAKLHDYMIRAQQLITVLMPEERNEKAIQKIIQRIDWEYVKHQYPQLISDSVKRLRSLSEQDGAEAPTTISKTNNGELHHV